jgi:hypothetical protein
VNAKKQDIRPASMSNEHWTDAISADADSFRSLAPLSFWLPLARCSLR